MEPPKPVAKNVFVLRVNNYRPDLCALTLPTIQAWAKKIGANYREITHRVYPEWPVTYEKIQVHALGADAAWNYLVDADFMLHPDLPDFTAVVKPDMVGIHYGFDADRYFTPDIYFQRCGHNQAIAGGFVLTSHLTHDLWTPLEFGVEEARKRVRRQHCMDEYCISRNLARFGLTYTGLQYSDEIARQMIHLGTEEKTDSERDNDLKTARRLYHKWFHLKEKA